ncbi:hypothetical protein HU200_052380 [Digitaria exilis]|uniref:Uncharacterized protein n=1 Tax=Digitaria exilis TaxID=1010633 RepID=A0A835ATK0_9POAL|nr:hypothetical protein HU200_052380 [Digitaria exilis]
MNILLRGLSALRGMGMSSSMLLLGINGLVSEGGRLDMQQTVMNNKSPVCMLKRRGKATKILEYEKYEKETTANYTIRVSI